MAASVLIVGGTHGNECNGPWLLQHWGHKPQQLQRRGLSVRTEIGNPAALEAGRRYIDKDLNRSFIDELLQDPDTPCLEGQRAQQLLASHGPNGQMPTQVLIDLHSTTAAMGNCLVLYGRRPADLALAAGCQEELGLPVYLHESDPRQTGFMAQAWPCGLALEVGPVAQGVLSPAICRQSELGLEVLLDVLEKAAAGQLNLRRHLQIHRHLGSIDLPRDNHGQPCACLHPQRLCGDWQELQAGDPLFQHADGTTITFAGDPEGPVHTVFSNEAAYQEKGIATSLTRKEDLPAERSWVDALQAILQN